MLETECPQNHCNSGGGTETSSSSSSRYKHDWRMSGGNSLPVSMVSAVVGVVAGCDDVCDSGTMTLCCVDCDLRHLARRPCITSREQELRRDVGVDATQRALHMHTHTHNHTITLNSTVVSIVGKFAEGLRFESRRRVSDGHRQNL